MGQGEALQDKDGLILFLLSSVYRRKQTYPAAVKLRRVPRPMLIFVSRGEGTMLLDGAPYKLEAGSLFYLAPGMSVEAAGEAGDWTYYIALLETITVGTKDGSLSAAPSLRLPPFLVPGRLIVTNAKQTLGRFERLYAGSKGVRCKNADRSLLQIRFQELLHNIVEGMAETDRGNQDVCPSEDDAGIGGTIRYMEERYAEKLTLTELARMAGFTPSSYSRAFAKMMGVPPIDYLTGIRIAGAKRLLSESGSRVKDVSASVGFENEFYFSRIFKQHVGVSPALFIKRRTIRVAAASCLDYQLNLQAVGCEPVAAVNCFRYPWMGDEDYAAVLAEQLAALERAKPDLIICDYFHEPLVMRLRTIAPAAVIANGPDWRVTHAAIAELVGLEDEAAQTFRTMEVRERAAASRLEELLGGETVVVLQINHRLARIQGTVRHPLNELLYSGLGLKPGLNIPHNHFRIELPPERLPAVEADRLFVHCNHVQAGSELVYERLRATSAWQAMKAVQRGRVRHIPNWFRMSWNPLGRCRIIGELLEAVEASVARS